LSIPPRPEVENLKICAHGGPDWAELKSMGLGPDDVLDFSVCSNPFPPPPGVAEVLGSAAISRYPDSEATELRQCLSERLGVAADNILAGSGATELIRLIALAYFRRGDSVLILAPTYGEYEAACQMVGVEVFKQWGRAENNFRLRIDETVDLIRQRCPRGIFICQPNNPTGQYLSRPEVEAVLEAGVNSLLVLDEAYIAFTDKIWPATRWLHRDNIIIVRSMTKDYALAGLRLGYAVANREIIEVLRRVRPPWNVNVLAQKAGVAALRDDGYLERCKPKIKRAKQFLVDELGRIGFTVVPSATNFFLVRVGNGQEFRDTLLRHGILVRNCASFGLPEYVRIAPLTMPECRKLIATIQTLRRGGELNRLRG
jgi:histidinol-phosphate aminotransferase